MRHFFTCPERIADVLPENERYDVVLTEDGVLYRPMSLPRAREEMPEWLRSRPLAPDDPGPIRLEGETDEDFLARGGVVDG